MEEINKIIGTNLMKLRKNMKLTQLELAEKFSYSDKSISKWESGESLPSIEVLYDLAKFYDVTLDDLASKDFSLEKKSNTNKTKTPRMFPTKMVITLLSTCAVWLVATIIFVLMLMVYNTAYPIVFLWAVPAMCVVLIVFNAMWGRMRYLFVILTVLLWTTIVSAQVQFILVDINIWPIYFVGIPLQIGIILWGALVKKPRGYYKNKQSNNN